MDMSALLKAMQGGANYNDLLKAASGNPDMSALLPLIMNANKRTVTRSDLQTFSPPATPEDLSLFSGSDGYDDV